MVVTLNRQLPKREKPVLLQYSSLFGLCLGILLRRVHWCRRPAGCRLSTLLASLRLSPPTTLGDSRCDLCLAPARAQSDTSQS